MFTQLQLEIMKLRKRYSDVILKTPFLETCWVYHDIKLLFTGHKHSWENVKELYFDLLASIFHSYFPRMEISVRPDVVLSVYINT